MAEQQVEVAHSAISEKAPPETQHIEKSVTQDNLVYDDVDEEPELHMRTYIALGSMLLLNLVQVFSLQGPPAVLSYIGTSLHGTHAQTWVPNSLSFVQAVVGPLMSSVSDTFQARKLLIVVTALMSFVGAAIAPGSQSIYRLIAAQTLIGFGFSSVPLVYSIPSEILPRKWRPMAQAWLNVGASIGAISGPLIIGAMTGVDTKNGWRNYYWIQMGLWGLAGLGILVGYRPPKRHTRLDHLSVFQKLARLDLPGFGLLTVGLTLFLTGLNLGGNLFAWTNARVLALLIIGIVTLIVFGLYEWQGTKTGILNHELFKGGKEGDRTFAISISLMFVEGILLFSYIIFYPVQTANLFEPRPFLLVVRGQPFWIGTMLSTVCWGYWSTRMRTIRSPLFTGFLFYTSGIIGLATIQPGQSTRALIFSALCGIGFGAPLILIISGIQLSTPHHLIATATAVTNSSRAVAATIFTAIYSAAFNTRIGKNLPSYVSAAALKAGLSPQSLSAFIPAILSQNNALVAKVPGVTPAIIGAAVAAVKQAFADSSRTVFIIAAPFGALACLACFFLGDMRKTMNYRVDAPVEGLTAKHTHHGEGPGTAVVGAERV